MFALCFSNKIIDVLRHKNKNITNRKNHVISILVNEDLSKYLLQQLKMNILISITIEESDAADPSPPTLASSSFEPIPDVA